MSYLKAQQIVVAERESDLLLDRVRLNIALRTETPLLVQNNIAKVGGSANLRLVGPFNEPSMVGSITLERRRRNHTEPANLLHQPGHYHSRE